MRTESFWTVARTLVSVGNGGRPVVTLPSTWPTDVSAPTVEPSCGGVTPSGVTTTPSTICASSLLASVSPNTCPFTHPAIIEATMTHAARLRRLIHDLPAWFEH